MYWSRDVGWIVRRVWDVEGAGETCGSDISFLVCYILLI